MRPHRSNLKVRRFGFNEASVVRAGGRSAERQGQSKPRKGTILIYLWRL